MFIYDRPIVSEEEDFLSRTKFSKNLGQSIASWGEKESLVIALYGEWGSGKSSVINLSKEYIEKRGETDRPTVIEFNPWIFSDLDNLTQHFFTELAKELELKNDSKRDQEIAGKLRLYASILNLSPEKTVVKEFYSKIVLGLGLAGISSNQILQWLNISSGWTKYILFFGGLALILFEMFKGSLTKLADLFDKKAKFKEKTIFELKNDIRKELTSRGKRLLIIIDDIDRLSQVEIRQIFRLIRINADFPNTIYLLSFDRKIIEKNLEEQAGVSGKDYLEKIVQVNFDIPLAKPNKIAKYLFDELDRVLDNLPQSAMKFFEKDDTYWSNVYHSGFKNFFKNIRDVKRFISSLEFNISQMYVGEVMEVNPIDFIAVEAIRLFTPEFYEFMKSEKDLFTSTNRDSNSREGKPRKTEIENALNLLEPSIKESVLELIRRLFPQIDGVFQYGYSSYGYDWQSTWSKSLRVCASNNFDSYFTLIPGGDEEELGQFEIENILSKIDNTCLLEEILREFTNNNKIRKVLTRFQDYTDDLEKIPPEAVPQIIQALFNISDEIPSKKGMWDFGADMDLIRIIFQLLKREKDKTKNYVIIKDTILNSKGLYGPLKEISIESSGIEKGKNPEDLAFPDDKIGELQKLCVEKMKVFEMNNKLLEHNKLIYILYRWKEWDRDQQWIKFVENSLKEEASMLIFLSKFITESQSQTIGDYGYRRIKKFNYKSLQDFAVLDDIKLRLERIKTENLSLYKDNAEVINIFLKNFGQDDDF